MARTSRRRAYASNQQLSLDERINITPFVDVVLVLLIAFMITAPLLTATIPVTLPQARGAASTSTAPLVITVRADGEVFLDNTPITDAELPATLAARRATIDESAVVFVRADANVPYGRFVQVASIVRDAQFTRLSLVSLPIPS